MPSSGVFCFLWDDPLFNPAADSAKKYLDDPEFIALRREERLLALELLYIKMAALERLTVKWEESAGRHCWALISVLERAEIDREILEAVQIEEEVNSMDPDFSFVEWLREYSEKQHRAREQ